MCEIGNPHVHRTVGVDDRALGDLEVEVPRVSHALRIDSELRGAILDGQVGGLGCRGVAVGPEQLQKLEARRSRPPCREGERRIERNQTGASARYALLRPERHVDGAALGVVGVIQRADVRDIDEMRRSRDRRVVELNDAVARRARTALDRERSRVDGRRCQTAQVVEAVPLAALDGHKRRGVGVEQSLASALRAGERHPAGCPRQIDVLDVCPVAVRAAADVRPGRPQNGAGAVVSEDDFGGAAVTVCAYSQIVEQVSGPPATSDAMFQVVNPTVGEPAPMP